MIPPAFEYAPFGRSINSDGPATIKLTHYAEGRAPSLRESLVRLGFPGCHVPVNPAQRRARQPGLSSACAGLRVLTDYLFDFVSGAERTLFDCCDRISLRKR
jgi:hypothetical protein